MIEVLIVVSILIFSFTYIFMRPHAPPDYSDAMMVFEGRRALESMPMLRVYAEKNDTDSIKSELRSLLPNYVNFDISLCRDNCTPVDLPNETVDIVKYYSYGWKKLDPVEIRLFLWSD